MNGPNRPGAGKRFRDWTGPARAYARLRVRRLDRLDAGASQRRTLARLLAAASDTAFGRAHGFAEMSDLRAYQNSVPLRDHDAFWEEWWKASYPTLDNVTWPGRIPYFARTSGTTTGRSKYIPYTTVMRRAAARGLIDLLCFHLVQRPESRLLGGAALGLTGPTELDSEGPNVSSGAVSAITGAAVPSWFRDRVLPPFEIANLPDWEQKIRRLSALSRGYDVRFIGGSPNWLLVFLGELAKRTPAAPDRLVSWYPELELIVHGGMNFAPYRQRFHTLLEGSHAETREMYSASEGVFAVADRGDGDGLRLHLQGSVFYEFVPEAEARPGGTERHWIGNAETGRTYALAITTAAGLWSYLVGDLVELIDLDPPRLRVVGRLGQGLSAFGEHLIEDEISRAVTAAADRLGLSVRDFSVGVAHAEQGGFHDYLVETLALPGAAAEAQFAEQVDKVLCEANEDYEELRARDLALGPPRVRFVAPGGFLRWMRSRRGLGGQNKVPRIVRDADLFRDIESVVRNHGDGDE